MAYKVLFFKFLLIFSDQLERRQWRNWAGVLLVWRGAIVQTCHLSVGTWKSKFRLQKAIGGGQCKEFESGLLKSQIYKVKNVSQPQLECKCLAGRNVTHLYVAAPQGLEQGLAHGRCLIHELPVLWGSCCHSSHSTGYYHHCILLRDWQFLESRSKFLSLMTPTSSWLGFNTYTSILSILN